MQKTYILIYPQHDYAIEFMRLIAKNYGIKPICLYKDRISEIACRDQYTALSGREVLGHYFLKDWNLPSLCDFLQKKYDILGVIPVYEETIPVAACMLQYLHLDWNDVEVLHLFASKYNLKNYLRKNHLHILLNRFACVRGFNDMQQLNIPGKIVIKPNIGSGSRGIGFFDTATPKQAMLAYFKQYPAKTYMVEEFMPGTEYAVNGQSNEQGDVDVWSVMRYEHKHVNGKPNVYYRYHHVQASHPRFAELVDYAKQVIKATKLRRCPFHLEIIDTPQGPCLVEAGARLGGAKIPHAAQWVHGASFDTYAWAAHHYLFDTPYLGVKGNWPHYNAMQLICQEGLSLETGYIETLEGLDKVMALPEFAGWVRKPYVGQPIHATLNSFTSPYAVLLTSKGKPETLLHVAEQISQMIQINRQVTPVRLLLNRARIIKKKISQRAQMISRRFVAYGSAMLTKLQA